MKRGIQLDWILFSSVFPGASVKWWLNYSSELTFPPETDQLSYDLNIRGLCISVGVDSYLSHWKFWQTIFMLVMKQQKYVKLSLLTNKLNLYWKYAIKNLITF